MENSIEEIEEELNKNLDFLIKTANKMEQLTTVNIVAMKQPTLLLFLSILSDYKRVLKENEEKNKIKEQKECTFREYGAEEGLWYCSNCHNEWLFYEGTPEENNLKYCPHCGAKVIKYESYIETEIEIANKMAKDYLKESEE